MNENWFRCCCGGLPNPFWIKYDDQLTCNLCQERFSRVECEFNPFDDPNLVHFNVRRDVEGPLIVPRFVFVVEIDNFLEKVVAEVAVSVSRFLDQECPTDLHVVAYSRLRPEIYHFIIHDTKDLTTVLLVCKPKYYSPFE